MERIVTNLRKNWKTRVESIGFNFHTMNNKPYWNEEACYSFKEEEIQELQKASFEIEKCCLEVVDYVVRNSYYEKLHIPEYAWPLIESSWKKREKSVYGRFDFSYDGIQPPKLLEYNADTPVCLLEASLVQEQWLKDARVGCSQYNCIHDRIVSAWKNMGLKKIHLTCLTNCQEDLGLVSYLANTITQAGLEFKIIDINKIMWDHINFVDEDNEVISNLYKLYPWEWMMDTAFYRIQQTDISIIEPAWKMILSNKGILVLLWELFPDHPNLLPAYFEPTQLKSHYVKKAVFGREGENITLIYDGGTISNDGRYGNGKFIYQQTHLLPNLDGYFPVIGSWIIEGEPSGIIVTEDISPITNGLSPAVPHFIE